MTSLEILDDLLPVLQSRQVLLIGEILGTREFPELVVDLVVNAVSAGQPMVVGLEVPFNEPLNGEHWGSFWQRAPRYSDGRSSQSMAELVAVLADLSVAAHPVSIYGLDGPWVAPGSTVDLESVGRLEENRSEAMAGHFLTAMDAHPEAAGLILAGSEHTGVLRGSGTMGSIIAPWFPGSVALMGLCTGGEALTLTKSGPEPRPVSSAEGVGEGAVWSSEPGPDGHHGFVNLGRVTAASPFPSEEA